LADLQNPDIALQGAAIIAIKKSLAHVSPSVAAYHRTLAAQHLKLLLDSHHEPEICMGLEILGIDGDSHDIDLIIPFLQHPSIQVARRAAKSITEIAEVDPIDSIRQAPKILSLLTTA